MHCPKYGSQLPDSAKFCGRCGAQLGISDVAQAAHSYAMPAQARLNYEIFGGNMPAVSIG